MAIIPIDQTDDAAGYEVIEHTADWALRVWGISLAALFRVAAEGMASLMVEQLEAVPITVKRSIDLEAFDSETLLVDWLSELAYWAEDELLVFREYDVELKGKTHLAASVRGGKVENLTKHIKAVTYNDLIIHYEDQFWSATIVFDV